MRSVFLNFGFFSILILFWSDSCAQSFSFSEFESEKDSLRRIELGIESWNYFLRNNIDSIRIAGQEIINDDSLSLYPVGVRNLGSYYIRTNDISKGVELLKEAKDMFSMLEMTILLSETENELGNGFFLQGNYNQASRYYLASIIHGSKSSDVTARYNGMIGFGKTLCAIGDTVTGLLFVQEYLERCLRDEKFEAASDACGYLGMIAGLNGRIELMSAYYKRSVRYASKSDSKTHKANAYTNRAIDYFYHNKVDSAIYYFQQSLLIREEVGATRPIVESLYNLGLLNIETDKLDQATMYLEKAELLADQGGIKSWQLDCLVLLLEIAEKRNNESEIVMIQRDMARIKSELQELGTLDENIINTAIEFSELHDPPIRTSFLEELIGGTALLFCCCLMLYLERSNSTSVDTQV